MEKEIHIFWTRIEQEAIDQFNNVMRLENVVKWALMPDAHTGYVLPIWGVVAVKGAIYPAFIWYDIWCWVLAMKTDYILSDFKSDKREKIFNSIYRSIPCWEGRFRDKPLIEPDQIMSFDHTWVAEEAMIKWINQIWTLGWWNHFIEIAYDEDKAVWIVVHSWSRWVWHRIASVYMKVAKEKQNIDTGKFEKEFENIEEFKSLKKLDLEKYEEIKWNYIDKKLKEFTKWSNEWTYWLDADSEDWKNYILDMNFWLEFALLNRFEMLKLVARDLDYYLKWTTEIKDYINRNHNHAELRDWLWIHRKWATHAELWMLWVIPGNMRDWSFIVRWKWNPDSLFSSSHGGWRAMSRNKAKETVSMDEFEKSMKWITAKVTHQTLDESPMAYKNIFKVMELQSDLVDVIHHLKPIINIKW
ncbi:MAG: hypothetical protein ACD_2C00052G0010 [uncultured bacterium (gcode 4)]|uniref:3'-phosphate/5'-hydroxy nucleic acid ligase n=1 Tax=uncultured bacterium (gcode 4) TaxID=1234023 RepID=K2GHW6_9BACT|nr:MAG: hypothetical protein ACD_2C00052G0010 [uncultured bacterium (gcode 4)]